MVEQATGAAAGGSSDSGADGVRGAAREGATRVVDQLREQAEAIAKEKKAQAAERISGLAAALRKTADELGQQEHGKVADYVGRAAAGLEDFSESIRDRDLGELIEDVERFARRYPALFFGGTVMAGFLFARFLKSSAEHHRSADDHEDGASGSARAASTAPQGAAGRSAGAEAGTTGIGGVRSPVDQEQSGKSP